MERNIVFKRTNYEIFNWCKFFLFKGDNLIILKIGGSIITDKDSSVAKVDYDNLNRVCEEIKQSFMEENIHPQLEDGLVLVHGAGSFAHPPASKYKIGQAFSEEELPEKRIGFTETLVAGRKLDTCVCEALWKHDIPAVSLPPSSFITTTNKRITDCNLDLIKRYLELGFVPVLYGDVVLDTNEKFVVISGDQIIQNLASRMSFDRVVLGTDVDGVYDKNPKKHSDAKLIENVHSIEDITQIESTTNVDVTGGMIGKVKELLDLAYSGVSSEIVNANKPGIIAASLQNKKVKGTKISKK